MRRTFRNGRTDGAGFTGASAPGAVAGLPLSEVLHSLPRILSDLLGRQATPSRIQVNMDRQILTEIPDLTSLHSRYVWPNVLERFPFALAHGTRSTSLFESVIHSFGDSICADHALGRPFRQFRPHRWCLRYGTRQLREGNSVYHGPGRSFHQPRLI
jgi:hypothetical protein